MIVPPGRGEATVLDERGLDACAQAELLEVREADVADPDAGSRTRAAPGPRTRSDVDPRDPGANR